MKFPFDDDDGFLIFVWFDRMTTPLALFRLLLCVCVCVCSTKGKKDNVLATASFVAMFVAVSGS